MRGHDASNLTNFLSLQVAEPISLEEAKCDDEFPPHVIRYNEFVLLNQAIRPTGDKTIKHKHNNHNKIVES